MGTIDEKTATRLALSAWRVKPHTYARKASRGRWKMFSHLRYTGQIIYRAVMQGSARIIVNMPPRHGKSELGSFWSPIWYLDAFPEREIILASYGADLATDFGRAVRNEVSTNPLCMVKLREDSQAAGRFHTEEGGGMVCAGVGGPVTGRGGDLIIVDDPVKNWQDAHSRLQQRRQIEWFDTTLYTRAEPGASFVVIMQRWSTSDLTAHLVHDHADDWTVICLPAVAGADDPLGRAVGDPLCPERYDAAELAAKRAAIGAEAWEALYQQCPTDISTGKAYHNYSPANRSESVTLRDDLPLHLSVDFNSRPHMHCIVGQHDEAADMLTATHEVGQTCKTARDAGFAFADLVHKLGGWKWPELYLFGDASGRSGGRNVATGEAEWQVFQLAIRSRIPDVVMRRMVPRTNPPVEDSITTFNEALRDVDGACHYQHHPRCVLLERDFCHVKWDEEAGTLDKSDSALTHASDAERYRVWRLRPVHGPVDEVGGRFLV